ncbi:MAG: hypothetical protein ONB16_12775 [candidate division KSB1 bacterium]|nr:hypothetical protein [candidate division KSB1 bacterium]
MTDSAEKRNNWFSRILQKMPQQIRALIILVIIFLAAFIFGRRLLIPKTFGIYGHYRAAAVDLNLAVPARYAGQQICKECHEDIVAIRDQHSHRTIACESCHGPGLAHSESPDDQDLVVPKEREFCIRCHDYIAARPKGFPQINAATHNPGKSCLECHPAHAPTLPHEPGECSACHSQVATALEESQHQFMSCTDCHQVPEQHKMNPRANKPVLPQSRELCADCHAEGRETTVDAPRVELATHGGNYVCWQCHYPHFPEVKQ